jgi:DNA-binding response OmpR family regulator
MKKRILVLDDNNDILAVLEDVLSHEGFEAITVDYTEDFLALVRFYRPDLILLDFSLNGENGGVLCTRLKNDPEFAGTPVIIFSAFSNRGFQKGTYGCDYFINKPFDLVDLIASIRMLTVQEPVKPGIER